MSHKTVTINGIIYDAHTGLPVAKAQPAATPEKAAVQHKKVSSAQVHRPTQKSQTLNRKIVKPVAAQQAHAQTHRRPIQKSPHVTRFAPHPSGSFQNKTARMDDIAPALKHPVVKKAEAKLAKNHAPTHTAAVHKPSHILKQEAVQHALKTAPSHAKSAHKQHEAPRQKSRLMSVASASLALFLLGGYFTYLNMPNLSVRVAAAQAGIDASYPSYRPDGYRMNGPVAYDEGKVSMTFVANAGAGSFTVDQSETGWDSTAVKENYVTQKWGEDVTQYAERGLTIYTHDNQAVWVNGGILYTITGDAPLSASQIRGIATSM